MNKRNWVQSPSKRAPSMFMKILATNSSESPTKSGDNTFKGGDRSPIDF